MVRYRLDHVRSIKHLLPITIQAVLLAGCGESQQQQSVPDPIEVKLVKPVEETAKPEPTTATTTPAEAQPSKRVAEVPTPPAESKATGPNDKNAKPEAVTTKLSSRAANNALRDAAMKGNIESIKQHLDAGASVSAKNVNGWTPLYYAENKDVAERLITSECDN